MNEVNEGLCLKLKIMTEGLVFSGMHPNPITLNAGLLSSCPINSFGSSTGPSRFCAGSLDEECEHQKVRPCLVAARCVAKACLEEAEEQSLDGAWTVISMEIVHLVCGSESLAILKTKIGSGPFLNLSKLDPFVRLGISSVTPNRVPQP